MTFILDMSSGKEYAGEEFSCPHQITKKSEQPHMIRDDDSAIVQLVTVESTTSHKQPVGNRAGFAIDSLLASIED